MAEYIDIDAPIDFAVYERNRRITATLRQLLESNGAKYQTAYVRTVVRGKWVYDHWCEFKCSNCGAWSKSEPYRGRENFCPNCGADMRGES